jgi:hypothetical protein
MKMREFGFEERRIAYHEAGHAVMAHLLGYSVNYLWIKPGTKDGEESAGVAMISKKYSEKEKVIADLVLESEKNVKINVAGRVTEQLFFPDVRTRRDYKKSGDWENLRNNLMLMGHGNEKIQNIVIGARKILQKKEARKLIRKVAWVLLRHDNHLDYLGISIVLGDIKRNWRLKRKMMPLIKKMKKWFNG